MNKNFWKAKKVLVTGHTGFKGSWLSLWLQDLGSEVLGISLEPETNPNLFQVANIQKNMKSIFCNILDKDKLQKIIVSFEPEIIIHMAAQPIVRRSYLDPENTYLTNVMGTLNLLENVRKINKTKVFLNVTTDKCYKNKEWLWGYRESEPLGGYDPYSSSKACSEILTSSYRDSFFKDTGKSIATARAGNVIGGGDWSEDRLVPDIFKSILDGRNIIVRNPNAIRPWQHVLCPLSGYLELVERMYEDPINYSEAWNFGPPDDDARKVESIVSELCSIWLNGIDYLVKSDPNALHEATFLKLDCSKAKAKLNWYPKITLSDALSQICQWYKAFSNGEDMRAFTLKQIKNYENLK